MNQADTAWMLMSTALVLLMTPALAFLYGAAPQAEPSGTFVLAPGMAGNRTV